MAMTAPAPAPYYSCLLQPSFTVLTDVEDFLTQFDAFSTLFNWAALNPDLRKHFFSVRLTGDALTFYWSLTTAQKGDYDELKRLFRQQYQPNADVFKAQVKSLRQLSGQDMSAFYWTRRDLTGKVYTEDAARNELLLNTFSEGLANSVVRWEVRKAKLTVVEDAVSLAVEIQSYLNLYGQQPDTSAASVNNLTGPSPSYTELFSDLISTIKEEVERVVDGRSCPPQRGRSGESPTSSRSQQSESNNHTNRSQRRNPNQNERNHTNSRGNTPNRGQSHDSKNRASFNNSGSKSAKECQRCQRKNHEAKDYKACFKCGKFSAFLPQSVPTFNRNQPAHQRGGCAVEPDRLTNEPASLNSVMTTKVSW